MVAQPARVARIPAAPTAFAERRRQVWGYAQADVSTSSAPSIA
jgi:hypothetical protein